MGDAEGADSLATRCADPHEPVGGVAVTQQLRPGLRRAVALGVCVGVALTALAVILGVRGRDAHRLQREQDLFLQVGRRAAVSLSTISHVAADAEIQRIVDASTGPFRDEFQQRSQPFVAFVKSEQSQSVGTVTEAGLESMTSDSGRVLVAVSVDTTTAAAPTAHHNSFRMRIDLKLIGNDVKISDVEFIT